MAESPGTGRRIFFTAKEIRVVRDACIAQAARHRMLAGGIGDASSSLHIARVDYYEHLLEAALLDWAASRLTADARTD